MIKGVVFDVYGTLYDVFSVVEKCESIYPGKGEQISEIWRRKQLEYAWLRTLMNQYEDFWNVTKDALHYALDSMGIEHDLDKINNIMNVYFSLALYPEVIEALQKFHSYKLVILTNGTPGMLNRLVINTGLNEYFEGTLSADTVHLFKPSPEIYQLAVDFFGVNKKEILFVSSNAWDIAGAKSFGFTVGWINRLKQPSEQLGIQADYVVSNLLELAQEIVDLSKTSRRNQCSR